MLDAEVWNSFIVSNAVRYASQWGSLTREETPPPCVCTESWQTWRLNNFETSELLSLCNTPPLTSSALSPECVLPATPTLPALSCPCGWVTLRPQAVTQVWVTANDLPLSHMTLHFLYSYAPRKKRKKRGQEYVLIRVADDTHYWKAVTKIMTFLNGVQLCRNELPTLPCPLILNLLC